MLADFASTTSEVEAVADRSEAALEVSLERGCPGCQEHFDHPERLGRVWSLQGLLIVPLFRGSSRSESLILSHHSRFTCECNKEDINDDDDDDVWCSGVGVWGLGA